MNIKVQNLEYTYMKDTPYEKTAVHNVNMERRQGEFGGLIVHTGSGKSTLIQHLNGLLKPTAGQVLLRGRDIWADPKKIRDVRFKVGLVFQYPEYQLFEETVYKDIAFGPKNMKLSQEEIDRRVREAAAFVGITEEQLQVSPFDLSGGQKRRVAIAGVLAMKPKYLVLDEPTAGLDPMGREEFLELLGQLHQQGMTIIMVSHSMDDMARYAQRMIVMDHGKIQLEGTPREIFAQPVKLRELGLDVPTLTKLLLELKQRGLNVRTDLFEPQAVKAEIMRALKAGKEQATC
mgnify:CR=1 FL=1